MKESNRHWHNYYCLSYRSDTTPYAKQNGGQFNFVFDGHGNALPDDQVGEIVKKNW